MHARIPSVVKFYGMQSSRTRSGWDEFEIISSVSRIPADPSTVSLLTSPRQSQSMSNLLVSIDQRSSCLKPSRSC